LIAALGLKSLDSSVGAMVLAVNTTIGGVAALCAATFAV
jgi:hypothetical protein